MSTKTCFVIMPIGDQRTDITTVTQSELKKKYDTLIKEALSKSRPNMEITRADESLVPGTITTDIIARLMHSDYVIADVSYPNPNVFYELGLRHACHPGTVIIKDKSAPSVPFDIAHLRYVEYTADLDGLQPLVKGLTNHFDFFDREPARPDNHFLEYAKLTSYIFPDYKKPEEVSSEIQLAMSIMENPDVVELLIKQQAGEPVDQAELLRLLMKNPKVVQPLLQALSKSGNLTLFDNLKLGRAHK